MIKTAVIFLIPSFILLNNSKAQSIDYSLDSVNSLLCKKWEVNYAMVGGSKIYREPNAVVIVYSFNKDKTFVVNSDKPGEETKGTWIYNPKQKLIKLVAKGRGDSKIISLKEHELVMVNDTKNATPDDPSQMKMYYKIKAN